MRNTTNDIPEMNTTIFPYCQREYILQGTHCYSFMFYNGKYSKKRILTEKTILISFKFINRFKFLFLSISTQFPNILSLARNKLIKQYSYDRYFSIVRFKTFNCLHRNATGYFIQWQNNINKIANKFGNLFLCQNGGYYVTSVHVCDDRFDCFNTDISDEIGCTCTMFNGKCKVLCDKKKLLSVFTTLLHWY